MVKLLALAAVALAASTPVAVKPGSSQYGRILFDNRGFVLYAFTHDTPTASRCTGACAKAWPPYIVKTQPKGKLLGAIKRADGRLQVTFAGKPLYYYVGDRQPGQILCQNVREYGGLWLVVRPDGRYVR
jgi:predicted lipoprotein with Yx(FWY)xxD motif